MEKTATLLLSGCCLKKNALFCIYVEMGHARMMKTMANANEPSRGVRDVMTAFDELKVFLEWTATSYAANFRQQVQRLLSSKAI